LEEYLAKEKLAELGHYRMLVLPATSGKRKTEAEFLDETPDAEAARRAFIKYLSSLPTPVTVNKDAPLADFGIIEGVTIECVLDMGSCHMKRTLKQPQGVCSNDVCTSCK